MPARPRISSAAAAAAAVAHGDGFKPREERGWEEFHQDLDIEASFPVFCSYEVDGIKKTPLKTPSELSEAVRQRRRTLDADGRQMVNGNGRRTPLAQDEAYNSTSPNGTPKRRPGRPRRTESMLKGIGISPDVPKLIPPPGFNPREKLTLPKPSFRPLDPFATFEDREEFVDQAMSNVGYQESELWARQGSLIRVTEGNIEDDLLLKTKQNDKDDGTGIGPVGVGRVEYDMDEQDMYWLNSYNESRREEEVPEIKPWIFEVAMTKIEKEWHALEKRIPKPNPKPPQTHRPRSSSAAAVNGELAHGEEQDTKCAICDDGDCENTNAIVFCDGCDLAVHQECYGVPFIPEGQWLCRKCQLIGRGTPTCIFCPNTDGAFKQTNASRWSHLLCAIWIPEVSIGNATFMEPVMDVEKVPKQRWKLTCYICRQKMGACVQCGNKNCYIAFHVTCARRARLFLKMKSTHGGPASLDASVLKALCDKHVPAEWRREHDVDRAIIEAMDYYRYAMRGRMWADSQQAALTAIPPPPQDPLMEGANGEEPSSSKITLKLGTKNANRPPPPKIVWKLPSGAPVIPQALYSSIESSLVRFTIKKRKEFAAEVCKYWTLKREARRGAALLKRLQLQMETFTSMEIPRRNFVGMGAAGGVRLQRRIDFVETLVDDVKKIREITAKILEREGQKLEDAKILEEIVDTIYFPLAPLLSPILQKAQTLDNHGAFAEGFNDISNNIEKRTYPNILEFADDFASTIASTITSSAVVDGSDHSLQINGLSPIKSKTHHAKKEKTIAKRIVKGVQGSIEDAIRKECQLSKTSHEGEIQRLTTLLDNCLCGRHEPLPKSGIQELPLTNGDSFHLNGLVNGDTIHEEGADSVNVLHGKSSTPTPQTRRTSMRSAGRRRRTNSSLGSVHLPNGVSNTPSKPETYRITRSSTSSSVNSEKRLPRSGIPWYMENFRPEGTTIQEEQWKGRDLVDSELLSDMDEEEMSGLVDGGHSNAKTAFSREEEEAAAAAKAEASAKKRKLARKKASRGWTKR
ncbi:uncharacterized protein KY384_008487 [Bacidia gigantensis]|uniref:uncharacterized protein n=1 Tax=Bacidia gigantensis TaxID=2732470 RepID=UPI001D055FCC|nr:uncharacterized protein KY384_008487 [Bacidia gigantensis]KAG8527058.1 hypothetical protein KY384_008487 [Bacidia gigantensis]